MPTQAETHRTYGNWRRPRTAGLWRRGLAPTLLTVGVVVCASLISMIVGLVPGLAVFALTVPPLLVLLRPAYDGYTRLQRLGAWVGGTHARIKHENSYRSGPLGLAPCGTHQLPGLLAASQLSQTRDVHGRPFAVLCHPHVRHMTIVLESEPDGASLADQRQVDQWVAHHGEWLAALSREPGLIACQISIESSPDPGTRLRQMLADRRSDSAPAYADEVMNEIRDTYPTGAAELKARIALTYRMNAAGGRKLSAAEKAHEVGVRLPGLYGTLPNTGAGGAALVDAQRLCEIVRAAYDPAAAETIENARAAGWRSLHEPEQRWHWFRKLYQQAAHLDRRYRLALRSGWWEDEIQVELLATLGAWVGMFDYANWADPEAKARLLLQLQSIRELVRGGAQQFDPERDRQAFEHHLRNDRECEAPNHVP